MTAGLALYPFAVSESLTIRLADFDDPVNGTSVAFLERPATGPDEEGPARGAEYDLTAEHSWTRINFAIQVDLPLTELSAIVPTTARVSSDTALVVLITCRATRFRVGVPLRYMSDGRWSGHASIQRDDIKGFVQLRPQLVRTTSIPDNEAASYATRAGSLIAIGEPAAIYVDHAPASSGFLGIGGAVEILWEDFANSDESWRREHSDDVYHLEPFATEPRLWLNTRYSQVRDVLESTAKRGPEASFRDLTAVMIAQPVLFQLFTTALASLEIDEDSESVAAPSGWRADAAAMILPSLYPEEPSHEERLKRAARELRDGDGAASLMARLGSVVQELVGSYKTVEGAVRTFESTRERGEVNDD